MGHQTRPEPMNASPHHSKVKVALTPGNPIFIAGGMVTGKMELECRADKGLGIGTIMVELFAIQELTSRDHSATSTFFHSRRMFQGPRLPPSNAVQAYPTPGTALPPNYHQARRGVSTFLFRFPIPSSSPSSIDLGGGLARLRYELRATVGVSWKGERRLVTDKREVDVVEKYIEDFERRDPEGIVVGEGGKIWVQGRLVGGVVVAGEVACVELQVKNHSTKKNTGLSVTLTRNLHLPDIPSTEKQPIQIADTLTTIAFKGPEYIIPPGAEGVASLVFDVPIEARGVKGGTRHGDRAEGRTSDPLFEVRCNISVKIHMGLVSKDICLDLPVMVVHPAALPSLAPAQERYTPPVVYPYAIPTPELPSSGYYERAQSPYSYPVPPMSPPIQLLFIDQGQVWFPPAPTQSPFPFQHYSPPLHTGQQQHYTPPLLTSPYTSPPRPSSAEPMTSYSHAVAPGLPVSPPHQSLLPLDSRSQPFAGPEEGKGERASRITHHLRLSSRNRSVSPQSHRYTLASASQPLPQEISPTIENFPPAPVPPPINTTNLSLSPGEKVVHSPRPVLSPKQSFSNEKNSLPKSERVEELERMADEVGAKLKNLSADIPKERQTRRRKSAADVGASSGANAVTSTSANEGVVNKTLPGPPVPSGKERRPSPADSRTRVDTYFSDPAPAPSDRAPPTPTLTAVRKVARPGADLLSPAFPARSESGLDALERRLLAEVGTRKFDTSSRHTDVRAVLPIAIPPAPPKDPEGLNDSAISSLTLADRGAFLDPEPDSDERTHKAGGNKSSVSGDERERGRDSRDLLPGRIHVDAKRGFERERELERKREKKKDRVRSGEAHRVRKAAKGRVAEWLGAIEPDAVPLEGPSGAGEASGEEPTMEELLKAQASKADSGLPQAKGEGSVRVAGAAGNEEGSGGQKDVSSEPNPRSSGFVPVGTFKRDTFRRIPVGISAADNFPTADAAKEAPMSQARRHSAALELTPPAVKEDPVASPPRSPPLPLSSPLLHHRSSSKSPQPSSSAPVPPPAGTPRSFSPAKPTPPPSSAPRAPSPVRDIAALRKVAAIQPPSRKITFNPLPPATESKYDIRSARGGRGGKVTAVASIWAQSNTTLNEEPVSKANGKKPTEAPAPKPKPNPMRTSAKSLPSVSSPTPAPAPAPRARGPPQMRELVGRRAAPPALAAVSSSHATPMLSSTASLARSPPLLRGRPAKAAPAGVPTTIAETLSEVQAEAKAEPVTKAGGSGELAFGQARLRDLIKKYQGQTT